MVTNNPNEKTEAGNTKTSPSSLDSDKQNETNENIKDTNAYIEYANYCRENNKEPLSIVKFQHRYVNKLCSNCGLKLWACGCGGHCHPFFTGLETAQEIINNTELSKEDKAENDLSKTIKGKYKRCKEVKK